MDEETVSTVPDIVVVTDGAGLEISFLTATYPILKRCIDNTQHPIREPKRGSKDLSLLSVAQNMGCQNTNVLAVPKLKSSRKPLKQACHDLYSPESTDLRYISKPQSFFFH